MSIEKRNGKYYSRFKIHGKQKHILCHGARTEKEARAIEDAEKYKLRQQMAGLLSSCENVRFSVLLKIYEKHAQIHKARSKGEKAIINHIRTFFKDMKANDIKPATVQSFMDALLLNGLSPATVNKHRGSLCTLFNLGIDNNKCEKNADIPLNKCHICYIRTKTEESCRTERCKG